MANENKLTPELFKKCKEAVLNAKSAEDILAIAKQNNIEITAEIATDLFDRRHKSGELSDDELGNVSGGGCLDETKIKHQSPTCCGVKMVRFSDTWEGDFSLSQYRCPVCQRVKKEVFAYKNGELVYVI